MGNVNQQAPDFVAVVGGVTLQRDGGPGLPLLQAVIDGDAVIFCGGRTGEAHMSRSASTDARILAHWEGYCQANGLAADPGEERTLEELELALVQAVVDLDRAVAERQALERQLRGHKRGAATVSWLEGRRSKVAALEIQIGAEVRRLERAEERARAVVD